MSKPASAVSRRLFLRGAAGVTMALPLLEGLAPTNKFIIVHAVVYAEVRDGRLFRARTFFDLYDAAVQLGVLPKPGTLGERALLLLRGFGITRR